MSTRKTKTEIRRDQPIVRQTTDAMRHAADETFASPEFVASATECTGLSPAAVLSEQEADAYAQLYSVHRQLPSDAQGPSKPGRDWEMRGDDTP